MKLGVFAMIPQLNAKARIEVTSITERQKSSSSKVKSEENACVFLRQHYSPRVCPSGTNCHWKFLFECSGTPMEEDSPCPARVLSTRQLVSSARQCTGSLGSCHTRIFSPKTSVRAESSALLPWFIPCDYFLFPKLKLPFKGCLFEDVQDIQGAVTLSLRAIPQEDVQRSFQSLLDCATRCIDAEGMYFKWNTDSTLVFCSSFIL